MITNLETFYSDVIQEMVKLIKHYLSWERFALPFSIIEEDVFAFAEDVLRDELWADIERFVKSDPAANSAANPHQYVFSSYKGVTAILYYRIANHLIYQPSVLLQSEVGFYRDPFDDGTDSLDEAQSYFFILARKISEDAAKATGIEINPSAKIKQGFVIDHGTNTSIGKDIYGIVVGETCEIGENCTILNGVTIGALEVNQGVTGKRRHPRIGSNVTICANARVLGPINIGNNVFISPFAVITHDIPDNFKVSIINQLQLERKPNAKDVITIYGVIPYNNHVLISGDNLSGCKVYICNSQTLEEEDGVDIILSAKDRIEFSLKQEKTLTSKPSLCIQRAENRIYILQPNVFTYLI